MAYLPHTQEASTFQNIKEYDTFDNEIEPFVKKQGNQNVGQENIDSNQSQHGLLQWSPIKFSWLTNIINTYDSSFLILVIFQYFLAGFKIYMDLSVQDLFKLYL